METLDQELPLPDDPQVSRLSLLYAGISLTPTDSFESGFTVLDGRRQIVRMDKFLTDALPLQQVACLAQPEQMVVAIDLPKNISINGKFRFEKIRMHPFRTEAPDGSSQSRYADRLDTFLQALMALGIEPVLFSASQVRQAWHMQPPYRSRSSQYCKQLHSVLRLEMGVTPLSTQMPAASLLDALVASLVGWSMFHGQAGEHYQLEPAEQWPGLPPGCQFYRALQRVPIKPRTKFKRFHVRY
jgi:hypothetical protein